MEISGIAHCRWVQNSGDRQMYIGDETYLNERTVFVGGHGGGNST